MSAKHDPEFLDWFNQGVLTSEVQIWPIYAAGRARLGGNEVQQRDIHRAPRDFTDVRRDLRPAIAPASRARSTPPGRRNLVGFPGRVNQCK